MRVKPLLVALCIAALAAPAAARARKKKAAPKTPAEALAQAQTAFDQGFYNRALGLLKPLVDAGQARAMVLLGRMYEEGKGTPQNFAEAVALYGRANARRDLEARYRLALMYLNGRGVPEDDEKALHMIQGAAKEGYPAAETQLGLFYSQGDLLPRDYGAATSWYEKAAASGDAEAQYSLGLMYDSGVGLPQQEVNAAQWFHLAAEQGHARAQYVLGLMYSEDTHLGPKRPVEAYQWLALAARGGVAEAKQKLGEFSTSISTTDLQAGIAAVREKDSAIRSAKQSAGHNGAAKAAAASIALTPAQEAIEAFSTGHYEQAYRLAEPLVAKDDADALFLLGVMYDGGFYVAQDARKALNYMKLAAEHDYGAAEFSLGVTFEWGLPPVPSKDLTLAYFWYSLAGGHGDEDATDKVTQLGKGMTQAQLEEQKARIKQWRAEHARRKNMGIAESTGPVEGLPAAPSARSAAMTSLGVDTKTVNGVAPSTSTSHAFDYFGK